MQGFTIFIDTPATKVSAIDISWEGIRQPSEGFLLNLSQGLDATLIFAKLFSEPF